MKHKGSTKNFLVTHEIVESAQLWTKYVQHKYFFDKFKSINSGKRNVLKGKSGLYTDEKGLIRCGGRFMLTKSHPQLLPKDSHFTNMIIIAAHMRNLHAGVSQTLAGIINEYWIVQRRSAVQKVIRKCLICIHWEGGPFKTHPFASYPEYVTAGNEPSFIYIGID